MKPVKLKDIVDEMELQIDEHHTYLNKVTGEIITVSSEDLSTAEDAEDGVDFSTYPDWQQDSINDALDVIENWENYVELPGSREINEYEIMEEFCESIENMSISNALCSAIEGRGAFGRFKDAICRFRIEDDWYKFREEAFKQIAIDWCEENEIMYE